MPGKVDEKKWQRAKEIVTEQKGHAPKGKDYGLVQHVYQGMKKEEESNSDMAEATTTNIERKAKYLKELMDRTTEDSPPWVVGKLAQAKTHVQDVMDYVGTDGVKKEEEPKEMGCIDCGKQLPKDPMTNPAADEWMVLKHPEGGLSVRCPHCTDKKHGVKKSALEHLKSVAREFEKSEVPFQLSEKWPGLDKAMKEWDGLKGVHKPATGKESQGISEVGEKVRELHGLVQQAKGKFIEPQEYMKIRHLKQKAAIRHDDVLAQLRHGQGLPKDKEMPRASSQAHGVQIDPGKVVELQSKWKAVKDKLAG